MADVGTCFCRDLGVHIIAVVVCSCQYLQPTVVWRESEKDRQRLREWKVGQMEKIEFALHLRRTLAAVPVIRELLKRPLIALILLFFTLPVFAQTIATADVIVAQENAFWRAYAAGNVTDLATLLQPSFTNVEQEIWTRDQVLTFVQQFHKQCSLAPVALVDPHVSVLAPTSLPSFTTPTKPQHVALVQCPGIQISLLSGSVATDAGRCIFIPSMQSQQSKQPSCK